MTGRPLLSALLIACAAMPRVAGAEAVSFNRQVRPILAEKCFRCHGPDQATRKARLRLDVREAALAAGKQRLVLVPGKPHDSEAYRRITATDVEERMPPVRSGLTLTPGEIETLRRWIEQGAPYEPHWSLVPPRSAPLPWVRRRDWVRNPIDHFVLAWLERAGLSPSGEASRTTLLRRVTLDLTGLPPTPAEIEAFLADRTPEAYEKVVSRLLRSPRYGERMALDWLDAARYADTNGYFSDLERQQWRWRDWVIAAFNQNLPFDQFTVAQLAGDLLPGASQDHLIATGFNRNHMANNETGIIDEEYRLEYVADRLETTATVWLGLTLGCARCHDHKYDPLSQKAYYQLFAFFNNVPEQGLIREPNPPPLLPVPTSEQQRSLVRQRRQREDAEQTYRALEPALRLEVAHWETTAPSALTRAPTDGLIAHLDFDQPLEEDCAVQAHGPLKFEQGQLGSALTFDGNQHLDLLSGPLLDSAWTVALWVRPGKSPLACILSRVDAEGDGRGLELLWKKSQILATLTHRRGAGALEVTTEQALPAEQWHHVVLSYDGSGKAAGLRLYVNGAAQAKVRGDALAGSIATAQPWRLGRRDATLGFHGRIDELRFYRRPLTEDEIAALYRGEQIRGILQVPAAKRSPQQTEQLVDYYVTRHAGTEMRTAWERLASARREEAALKAAIPTALVMRELDRPRATFVLKRGQYDQPGEKVEPALPAVLPPLPPGAPANRLGLARWLVEPGHPLTARVAVNRFWQHFFGEGLVKATNDFGAQGDWPSHPELLDWLAVEFVRSGWDVQALHRLIVTSATYRQASTLTSELLQRDPENRLLARGPRFRLPAEVIRDQALAAAGLLVEKVGGPSVKPYQPPGLWEAVSYDAAQTYVPDRGAGRYRRSLYTFWKRQSPPPALLTFDAPTRETCTAKRQRTNTPLQALVLMNDPTYVEAARGLACQAMRKSNDAGQRVGEAFLRLVGRAPEARETEALLRLYRQQRDEYRADPAAARNLVGVGASLLERDLDAIELAAWTTVVSVILNLDEAITRP